MAIVYQYNANAYYIGETNAFGGSMPHNCCAVAPDVQAGFTPQWDGAAWKQVENHTSKTWDGQAQAPTHYWLPTDTWDTPARHMTEPGPLPDGALLTAPAKPLEEAKAEAKDRLKAYRQSVEYSGFMLDGQRWDSEQKDELRLNSAYKLFENGLTEYQGWKVSDGVYITLTPALLQAATMGLMQHYGRAFAIEAAKIAEIDALTTTADVEAWLETELEEGWAQDE